MRGQGGPTMTKKSTRAGQRAIDRFWHDYLFILEKSSIPKGARRWYRQHAGARVNHHQVYSLSPTGATACGQFSQCQRQIARATGMAVSSNLPRRCGRAFANGSSPFGRMTRIAIDGVPWPKNSNLSILLREADPSQLVAPSNNPLLRRFMHGYADALTALIPTLRARRNFPVPKKAALAIWPGRLLVCGMATA